MQTKRIYSDESGEGQEILRAIRHSRVGITPESPLAFNEEEMSWSDFSNGLFADTLMPHFIHINQLVSQECLKSVIVQDEFFLDDLPEKLSDRLRAGSESVFAAREGARGMRFLRKLKEKSSNCSFTVAFVVNLSGFNIPLANGIISYAFMEWMAGKNRRRFTLENISECEKLFFNESQQCSEKITKVLAKHLSNSQIVA
ncbi:hypothetical protein OAF65_05795 [Verrucomicrobiales bacterium]|nr:hypothetical protein [Verrucomicrobiales bacterium]